MRSLASVPGEFACAGVAVLQRAFTPGPDVHCAQDGRHAARSHFGRNAIVIETIAGSWMVHALRIGKRT